MASPVNRDGQADDARLYAPPWARHGVMLEDGRSGAPPTEGGRYDPLSLEPQIVPPPPTRARSRWVAPLVLVGIAAGIAGGLTIITSRDQTASIAPVDELTHGIRAASDAGNQSAQRTEAPRPVVEDQRASVNESLVPADNSTRVDPPPVALAPTTSLHLAPDEVSLLLLRGQDMLKLGDIAGARLVLRRAAEAGNSEAALLLASTFDPMALRELGVIGFAPDLNQALSWYEKASALGSGEARRRLDRLGKIGNR